ncbi:hypothetical protein O0V09_18750 [Dasania sp. GY-19]|uniref:Uncharacterized protein n=1 Tax=Dasania phycosphaerae TaxID=2950436 RepID=A0A9J6RSI8_9GAMM|nr:hypothetical protein [Dasania phycosphaerae]MCZ0867241.1 hypothetical protein [Dasania phycosphaerae]
MNESVSKIDIIEKYYKAAPIVVFSAICLVSIPAYFYKMNITALFFGPSIGLLAFVCSISSWRTGKSYIETINIVVWFSICSIAGKEGLYWALPQTVGLGLLFWVVPFWVAGFALIPSLKAKEVSGV